jgi:hypothetical protein
MDKNLVRWKLRRWHKIFIIVLYQCISPVWSDVYVRTVTLGSSVILPCETNSSSINDITWRSEGKHHSVRLSASGHQFVISNFTLEDQGKYVCFYKNVSVDEVEVKVLGQESQSQLDSSLKSDSEDDLADSHYLRVLGISTAVSIFALVTLISAIVLIFLRQRSQGKQPTELKESPDEDESLELVPNITLNPSFNIDMLEHIVPDYTENTENSEHAFLVREDS